VPRSSNVCADDRGHTRSHQASHGDVDTMGTLSGIGGNDASTGEPGSRPGRIGRGGWEAKRVALSRLPYRSRRSAVTVGAPCEPHIGHQL